MLEVTAYVNLADAIDKFFLLAPFWCLRGFAYPLVHPALPCPHLVSLMESVARLPGNESSRQAWVLVLVLSS